KLLRISPNSLIVRVTTETFHLVHRRVLLLRCCAHRRRWLPSTGAILSPRMVSSLYQRRCLITASSLPPSERWRVLKRRISSRRSQKELKCRANGFSQRLFSFQQVFLRHGCVDAGHDAVIPVSLLVACRQGQLRAAGVVDDRRHG